MRKEENTKSLLRRLPSVEKLLNDARLLPLIEKHGRGYFTSAIRRSVNKVREEMSRHPNEWQNINDDALQERIFELAQSYLAPDLKRVINATGVIVHTNLGRAPLTQSAIEAVVECTKGYSNLEYDLEVGARGSRQSLIEWKLCELTGAESALVVNNNAGAVMLTLMALARGKEAVVSRGELVEIGGSFRIPDVMSASGAKMVEVGTTNKTHYKDYERAINKRTAMLLKVHRSNFFIGGFTKEVSVTELSELAKKYKLVLMVDLGSGAFVDTSSFGLAHEPTPMDALRDGADIVTFSGDKLLGGPQAGIIVGKKSYIEILKKHPVHRALRPDKMTLSALEATLRLYMQRKEDQIPVIAMLKEDLIVLRKRAELLKKKLTSAIDKKLARNLKIEVVESEAKVGGGALADSSLKSYAVALSLKKCSAHSLMEKLRSAKVPVIGRIEKDKVLLDMRTLRDVSDAELISFIAEALG